MKKRLSNELVSLIIGLLGIAILGWYSHIYWASFAAIIGAVLLLIIYIAKGGRKSRYTSLSSKKNSSPKKGDKKITKLTREEALRISDLNKLSGQAFEQLLKYYYEDQGYRVQLTATSGDFGVDLILTDPKDGMKIAVQVKHWKKPVNLKAVQEVAAGRRHHSCLGAWVVTTSVFQQSARDLAEANNVRLIAGSLIRQQIREWQKRQLSRQR